MESLGRYSNKVFGQKFMGAHHEHLCPGCERKTTGTGKTLCPKCARANAQMITDLNRRPAKT